MVVTIAKWGNSLAVRILQHLAKEINLAEDSQVQLVLIDGRLTIEPITRGRYSLEELIEARQRIFIMRLTVELLWGTKFGDKIKSW
ncbi:AbrB/MazE/SpoVT family DNA-binding domain-containing protein [Microcoleus sp. B9-D4]|uniref:AbrB/MazE/SpoVT family DNA-binding domain-containing protein n=1 Tax=Microcoleus sp. B9-D4 TaxID=2818711 RepID=UPI002FD0A528